jgi:hypothetical protein
MSSAIGAASAYTINGKESTSPNLLKARAPRPFSQRNKGSSAMLNTNKINRYHRCSPIQAKLPPKPYSPSK